ncbi:hypothetical protein KB206_18515, partial [Microvirga sp. STS02]|uniref:hypothetical protein n=1 Tax=Hymenobacter negativus TaxID=2795026 RepID=UPI001B813533
GRRQPYQGNPLLDAFASNQAGILLLKPLHSGKEELRLILLPVMQSIIKHYLRCNLFNRQ